MGGRSDLRLAELETKDVAALIREDAAYYFLIAAANLNRTTLRAAALAPEALIVPRVLRKAHVIKQQLPIRTSFETTANKAVALREGDIRRKGRGSIEGLFRDRLVAEGIPIYM